MPSIYEAVKPTPVPRCPERHPVFRAGCETCRKWSRYQRRMTIWERAHGISRALVSPEQTRAHLEFLTTEGNRNLIDIVTESGISDFAISAILAGRTTKILRITEQSLLALKPSVSPRPRRRNLVASLEGVRILRGLFAQGWCWPHLGDLLGGLSRNGACNFARKGARKWMEQETLVRIRAVARELGPFDVDQLPEPLPGMLPRCATQGRKNGWHKLSYWDDRDITAEDSAPAGTTGTPATTDHVEADEPDEPDVAFIDPLILKTIEDTSIRIRLGTPDDTGRAGNLWIPTLEGLHQLELHAAWWYAENAGLNDTHIGVMFGYDMTTEGSRSYDAGQRQINRIRDRVLTARAWTETHRHGQVPNWFTEPSGPGRSSMSNLLPALIALQPAPFGAGWTVEQLADACGVTTQDMAGFVAYATSKADMLWKPQTHTTARRGRRPRRCARPTQTRVAA